jgi:predicted dehydrogenase
LISTGFSFRRTRTHDVRLDPGLGGGSLWDIGCYAVNLARLLARTEPVAATGIAVMAPSGVDDSFSGLLQFPGALVASVHSSFRAEYRTWLEVTGGEGALRVTNPFRPGVAEHIEIERGEQRDRIPVEGSPALFVRQVEDFVAAALDGKAPRVSLSESRGNAAALAALYASAGSGRTVTI